MTRRLSTIVAIAVVGISTLPSQADAQNSAPIQPLPLTLLPPHTRQPTVHFGLAEALKTLPATQRLLVKPKLKHEIPFGLTGQTVVAPGPIDCELIKPLKHERLLKIRTITPPLATKHTLRTIPIPPCPSR
ncbi:MAG: hypothetical protein HQ485_13135 [Acidobacteria bacterium]|jgi:hypothetical protein|nr:hypothetical protein [Acidobacteriota bacterium]